MTEHLTTEPGFRLCYTIPDEAWYRRVVHGTCVTVSKSANEGGCDWEFDIVQVENIGIQAQLFDDAFAAFSEVAPLSAALAAQRPQDLGQVRALLDSFGLPDVTPRENPSPKTAPPCACGCPREACAESA